MQVRSFILTPSGILYLTTFTRNSVFTLFVLPTLQVHLACEAEGIPWLKVSEASPHSLFEPQNCKVACKPIRKQCWDFPSTHPGTARNFAAWGIINTETTFLFLQLHRSAANSPPCYHPYRHFYEGLHSEMKVIWSMLPHLPSHQLEHIKCFRLASASTVVISRPITLFLPLLPIQQHHYCKLRTYSSRFENMSSLSLTSIPTFFEQLPASFLLVIFSFIWWKSPLL